MYGLNVYEYYKSSWLHAASIKIIFGTRLGLFLARSTLLLAYGTLWPWWHVATT